MEHESLKFFWVSKVLSISFKCFKFFNGLSISLKTVKFSHVDTICASMGRLTLLLWASLDQSFSRSRPTLLFLHQETDLKQLKYDENTKSYYLPASFATL